MLEKLRSDEEINYFGKTLSSLNKAFLRMLEGAKYPGGSKILRENQEKCGASH